MTQHNHGYISDVQQRRVCIVNLVSKVVSWSYFRRHMFNSRVQPLICSLDVLQTANTSKRIY